MGLEEFKKSLDKNILFLEKSKNNIENYFNNLDIVKEKKEELKQGLAGGNKIIPMYDIDYLNYKKSVTQYNLNGTPDLFLSGDFYKSLFSKMEKLGVYNIFSDLSKDYFIKLINKYNIDLLELTDFNKNKLIENAKEYIKNVFQKR